MEASEIKMPTPNNGAFSVTVYGAGCRVYVRNNEDWTPEMPATHIVGIQVWGSYGPLIGAAMRVEGIWFGTHGFVAKYRTTVSEKSFPDHEEAVKWILDQRKADPNRTDNGLRDTELG